MVWKIMRSIKLLATAVATLLLASVMVTQLAPALGDVPVQAAGATSVTRNFQAPTTSDTAYRDVEIRSNQNATNNVGNAITAITKSSNGTSCGSSANASCGRVLLWFDQSMIPAGSTISSAAVTLSRTAGTTARTNGLHAVTRSWVEGTGANNSGANWPEYDGANTWTTAGADFNATASQTLALSTTTGAKTWTSSASLISDVSGWVNTSANNFGWLLKDESETDSTNVTSTFGTKENTTAGNRPKLAVTYTAVWDSYSDSGRTTQSDDLTVSTQENVYMQGTGFNLAGSYIVAYYDATGYKACTDTVAASGGTLNSSCRLVAGGAGAAGTWHAVVFQPTGTAAATYGAIVADTNLEVADDTFTVAAGALVPEFPSVAASATAMVLLATIYFWFNRRPVLGQTVVVQFRSSSLAEKRNDVVSTELDQRYAAPKLASIKELNHYPTVSRSARWCRRWHNE